MLRLKMTDVCVPRPTRRKGLKPSNMFLIFLIIERQVYAVPPGAECHGPVPKFKPPIADIWECYREEGGK